MEQGLMQTCGLGSFSDELLEEYSFLGFANENETPYDFSSRLLSMGYTRVTTVPLWRLPQFPRAWQQFLEHNQCVSVGSEG